MCTNRESLLWLQKHYIYSKYEPLCCLSAIHFYICTFIVVLLDIRNSKLNFHHRRHSVCPTARTYLYVKWLLLWVFWPTTSMSAFERRLYTAAKVHSSDIIVALFMQPKCKAVHSDLKLRLKNGVWTKFSHCKCGKN